MKRAKPSAEEQDGVLKVTGIGCNDRKVDTMTLRAYRKPADPTWSTTHIENVCEERKTFQVYAVPDGIRGSETKHFKIIVNGIAVEDTDIARLRERATKVFSDLDEANYEKVLVVRTDGHASFMHRLNGETFGVTWQIGWLVPKLGIVLSEDRKFPVDVRNERREEDEHRVMAGIKVSDDSHPSVAVMPWTKGREDVLKMTCEALVRMRAELDRKLRLPEEFANMLDSHSPRLLVEAT